MRTIPGWAGKMTPMRTSKKILGPGLLVAALALSGCGSSGGDAATTTAPSASTTAASDSSGATDGSASSDAATVDANTASVDEMAAAFEAAGVANADRWAREVEEYRPYSGTDDWAHLKQELSKYNIDDATLQQILSTLTVNG